MQSFMNLKVWEKAHVLTLDVYKSSKCFPRDEIYGLTSQMRRSAASIGANIAELEYHLLLARDLELLPAIDYQRLSEGAIEVKRMLASFLHKLRADS